MLKFRIIPVLLLKDNKIVKGKQFQNYKTTGIPLTSFRTFSALDSDELAFINIGKGNNSINDLISSLHKVSSECFIPLLAGGGITEISHVHQLFKAGADKVLITTSAFYNRSLLREAVDLYGSQSIVAGIDYYEHDRPFVAINHGQNKIDTITLEQYSCSLESTGVGEIFLNCISRDGMMSGMDNNSPKLLLEHLSIPIISCGGAGHVRHLKEHFNQTNVSAIACSSLFHFADNNPIRIRSFLKNSMIPVRSLK